MLNHNWKLKGFTLTELDGTLAKVNRESGEVWLNKEKWPQLPEEIKTIILLHEEGHFVNQTSDEIEADNYAFQIYAGKEPESLRNLVRSLKYYLNFSNSEHYKRLFNRYMKALEFDFSNYNNTNAKTELERLTIMDKYIVKEFNNFLDRKGIIDPNRITDSKKSALLTEFLLSMPAQLYILNRIGNISGYEGNLLENENISHYNLIESVKDAVDTVTSDFIPETFAQTLLNNSDLIAIPIINDLTKSIGLQISSDDLKDLAQSVNPIKVSQDIVNNNLTTATPEPSQEKAATPAATIPTNNTNLPKPNNTKWWILGIAIAVIVVVYLFSGKNSKNPLM